MAVLTDLGASEFSGWIEKQQPPAPPPPEPTWSAGTEYGAGPGGMYTDQSGNISLDAGATWFDPKSQQVWNPQATQPWQSIPTYNDWWKTAQDQLDQAQGAMAISPQYQTGFQPPPPQITPQAFTQFNQYTANEQQTPPYNPLTNFPAFNQQTGEGIDQSQYQPYNPVTQPWGQGAPQGQGWGDAVSNTVGSGLALAGKGLQTAWDSPIGSGLSLAGQGIQKVWDSPVGTGAKWSPYVANPVLLPFKPYMDKLLSSPTTSLLPQGVLDKVPTEFGKSVVGNATSPLGLAFLPLGAGGGAATGSAAALGLNLAAIGTGTAAQMGTKRYGETNLPGSSIAANPFVQAGAGLVGGMLPYAAAPALAKAGAKAILPSEALQIGPPKFGSKIGEIPHIGGAADVAGMSAQEAALTAAKKELADSLKSEINARRVGTVAREISTGRSTQAKGIAENVGSALGSGATPEQVAAAGRAGARTGPLSNAGRTPLSEATKTTLNDSLNQSLQKGDLSPFEWIRAQSALDKLATTDLRPQPNEIKLLRKTFGDEIANLAESRPISAAQRAAQDAKLAISTNARNEAAVARQGAEAERLAQQANRLAAEKQGTLDAATQRLKWKAIARGNTADEIQTLLSNPFLTSEERAIAQKAITAEAGRAQNAAGRITEQIWAREKRANPDAEDLLRKAMGEISKAPPEAQAALTDSAKLWIAGNRTILDGIGDAKPQILSNIQAALTGDLADSYTTALLHRKAFLTTALKDAGIEDKAAKDFVDTLVQRELKLRFSGGVPDNVQAALNAAKTPYDSLVGTILRGGAAFSQEFKNTMFGPADVGVFGQQALKAGTTGAPQILAGITNRVLTALHLPHVDTEVAGMVLTRRVQNELDGVIHGVHTGIVGDVTNEGTLLRLIPYLNKLDPFLSRGINKLSDFQFNTVLGNIRDLAYEGNLVLAKATGADIQNAAVRAHAAQFANALTSAAPKALNAKRALVEQATLLTPSMRRAQVAQIIQVAKGLTGAYGREGAVNSAATIISAVGSTLLVGKLINDNFGLKDFEFDPSKSGFGEITIPGGKPLALALDAVGFNPRIALDGKAVTFSVFPQEQIVKALAQSIRVLSEGNPEDLYKIGANLGISSASPPAQTGLAAAGIGYQPGAGYRYGDLGAGESLKNRLLDRAPIPPLIQDITQGFGRDSKYGERDQAIAKDKSYDQYKIDPKADAGWSNLNTAGRNKWNAEQGTLAPTSEGAIASAARRATDTAALISTQQGVDSQYAKPGTTVPKDYQAGKDWRDGYHTTIEQQDALYKKENRDFPYTGDPSKDPTRQALAERSALIEANKVGHVINWDAIDAWAAQNPAKQNLIDAYYSDPNKPNTDLTPMVTAYKQVSKEVGDSGFFDLKDNAWKQITQAEPSLAGYKDYYAWRDDIHAQLVTQLKAAGLSEEAAGSKADSLIASSGVSKAFGTLGTQTRTQWALANLQAALDAWRFGYYNPTKEVEAYLNQQQQAGAIK